MKSVQGSMPISPGGLTSDEVKQLIERDQRLFGGISGHHGNVVT